MPARRWLAVAALVALTTSACGRGIGNPPLERAEGAGLSGEASELAAYPWPPDLPRIPLPPPDATVADAVIRSVNVYDAPGAASPARTLRNPTRWGFPLSFLVREQRDGWLQVAISERPNGSAGWIRADQVTLRTVPNRIVVELGARRLTAYDGNTVLMQESVVVGTPATPTPLGDYFVDVVVDSQPSPGYGPIQLGISAYSEVHFNFGGGIGQVAIHGTNRPGLMGQAASNGCIRMRNDVIVRLAELAPVGTPVQIVA